MALSKSGLRFSSALPQTAALSGGSFLIIFHSSRIIAKVNINDVDENLVIRVTKKKEAKGTSVMGHINKGAATRTTDKSQKRSPN